MQQKLLRKASAVLLIGSLSMLFAEIFSGASQTWYITGWGWLLTFPLYTGHVLFFLWLAMRFEKLSILQLYFFGVMFGLYESWITKVLWAGYIDSAAPGMGTVLGVGVLEFPILVFFWHPVMSFILPVLVFELLTGVIYREHAWLLQRTRRKSLVASLFLILVSAFIANGNGFDIVSSNLSLIGTVLLVLLFYRPAQKSQIHAFRFKKKGCVLLMIYLAALYVATFFLLLPARIPTTILPYATIAGFYILAILLLRRSKPTGGHFIRTDARFYRKKDLLRFVSIPVLATNAYCLIPQVGTAIMIVTYLGLVVLGPIMFAYAIYRTVR